MYRVSEMKWHNEQHDISPHLNCVILNNVKIFKIDMEMKKKLRWFIGWAHFKRRLSNWWVVARVKL